MEKQLKLMNVSEGLVELNYGSSHFELQPGDVTPSLSVPEAQSYLLRNPGKLKAVNEEEGILEDLGDLETFPGHTKGVDDEDDTPPKKPQEKPLAEDPGDEPDEEEKPKPAPAVKPSGKKKKG